MNIIFYILHFVICVILIAVVLIQRGRGGGLSESFSGLESVFGTKTSASITRLTSIFAVLFFLSCLTLAFISVKESRSLIRAVPSSSMEDEFPVDGGNATEPVPQAEQAMPAPSNGTTAP